MSEGGEEEIELSTKNPVVVLEQKQNESLQSSAEKASESRHICVSVSFTFSVEIHADENKNKFSRQHAIADSGTNVAAKVDPDHGDIPPIMLGTRALAPPKGDWSPGSHGNEPQAA
ncbi:hypothetical protein BDR22DRAFT_885238 [Usnea florida]